MNAEELLVVFAKAYSNATNNMPIGCYAVMENGVYKAKSILQVTDPSINAVAEDGFSINGIRVFKASQEEPNTGRNKTNRYVTYIAITGNPLPFKHYGSSKFDYMYLLSPSSWKFKTRNIVYKQDGCEDEHGTYIEPYIINNLTGEDEIAYDKMAAEHKVAYALANKRKGYTAYEGDNVFDETKELFVEPNKL